MKRRTFLTVAGSGIGLLPWLGRSGIATGARAGDGEFLDGTASADIRSLFEANNEDMLALTEAVFRKCILDKLRRPADRRTAKWILANRGRGVVRRNRKQVRCRGCPDLVGAGRASARRTVSAVRLCRGEKGLGSRVWFLHGAGCEDGKDRSKGAAEGKEHRRKDAGWFPAD
jgi:hypothetical protein